MTTPAGDRAARNRRNRAARYAARVEIDGRMVAVNAREHGKYTTRTNHGCECEPCVAAAAAYNTPYRRERRRTNPDFRRRANEAAARWIKRHRQERELP